MKLDDDEIAELERISGVEKVYDREKRGWTLRMKRGRLARLWSALTQPNACLLWGIIALGVCMVGAGLLTGASLVASLAAGLVAMMLTVAVGYL